ncbi:MAG: multicopper oxidase domain-containing protein, partial [Steroidobacteraceae bacterium]
SAQVTPAIAPGKLFVAKMTPPRAGTFIYHTHWHDKLQLSTGLYGALIVLDPGIPFDPETNKIFVISRGGPDAADPVLLNGAAQPLTMNLRTGVKYRFRLINITPNNANLRVSLRDGSAGGAPANWRAVAKDGSDLPAGQAVMKPADQRVAVGETYDFEFRRDEPGELQLEVFRPLVRMAVTQTLLFEEPR